MEDSYLEIVNKRKQEEIANIKKCNEYTSKYGLILSDNQIENILERRKETLKETGRVELSLYESILLLILRLLYIEKRKELTTYSEEVTVLMEEIREKYAMLKIKAKPVMDKGMEKNFVRVFKRYNIIQNLDTDVNQ